jgi:hypothetical protein
VGRGSRGLAISPERHVVAVGTARYDYVPVVLELLNSPPPDSSFEDADHVVEADLDLPSQGSNRRWGGWGSNPRPADYENYGPVHRRR